MIEVIPAILVKSEEEFQHKFELVKDLTKWIQLDVADGIFAPNKTWGNPETIKKFISQIAFELHLMIERPEDILEDWLSSGVRRIFFHYETARNPEELLTRIKNSGIFAGIAFLSQTPMEQILPLVPDLDAVLVFSGSLGFYEGKFLAEPTLQNITLLRKKFPRLIIEVDGGINPETGKRCVEAGANILVSGSYIFGAQDIKKAIEELKSASKLVGR